ncbi:MAG: NUDIX hydrolase [Candidatus Limnocylindrales bacterium]
MRATSAGGLVVRLADGRPQIVLGKRSRERDGVNWTLPKGTPNELELMEQTALREVVEETGLEVEIGEPAGDIEYWFVQSGTRIHKTVHYFVMTATGGDMARHDHEFDEVRWFDLEEATRVMSHATERRLVDEAMPAIERRLATAGPASAQAAG